MKSAMYNSHLSDCILENYRTVRLEAETPVRVCLRQVETVAGPVHWQGK